MKTATTTCEDISKIARVAAGNHARFVRLLSFAISRAKRDGTRGIGKRPSAGSIRKDYLHPVAGAARKLLLALERLDPDLARGPIQSAAADLFSQALLSRLQFRDAADPNAALLQTLALVRVIEVADHASALAGRWFSKPGRKKGTGRPAFDMFVMQLLTAAETNGGKLTIYKTSYDDARWAGSLLRSIEQLRPFLPKAKFFPAGRLGSSLDTINRRWRLEYEKMNPRTPPKSPGKKR